MNALAFTQSPTYTQRLKAPRQFNNLVSFALCVNVSIVCVRFNNLILIAKVVRFIYNPSKTTQHNECKSRCKKNTKIKKLGKNRLYKENGEKLWCNRLSIVGLQVLNHYGNEFRHTKNPLNNLNLSKFDRSNRESPRGDPTLTQVKIKVEKDQSIEIRVFFDRNSI